MTKALLTMDDFATKNILAIVDYLEEKHIPVILFACGKNVEKHYDEAIYAIKKGIVVGNHSYSHPNFSHISLEDGINEIKKCEEVLNKLYKDAGMPRRYRPFRFPYGDKGGDNKASLQKYLADEGFDKVDDTAITYLWWKENGLDRDIDTFWTFDFAEYNIRPDSGFTLDDVFKRMYDPSPKSGAPLFAPDCYNMILFHSHDETEEMVPEYYRVILDECLKNGVEFVEPKFIG